MWKLALAVCGLLWAGGLLQGCSGGGGDLPPKLRSEAAQQRGRALFLNQCAFCHGVDADGKGLRQNNLSSPPRDFTSPAWRRRVTHDEVFHVIRNGVPGTSMPPWANLSDDQVWDLTAYLLSVSGSS